MFEVIREFMVWLTGFLLDREPQGGEAIRLFFLLLSTIGATWAAFYWRDIAFRSGAVRRRLLPNERYAGRYLQAVLHGGEVRYAIVTIFYNLKKKRFEVTGRAYDPDGDDLSTFKSVYVLFPSDKDDNIEFIWQGRQALSANSLGGYTRMTVAASEDDYVEGTGLIMTFGEAPKMHQLRFKHLHDQYVSQALGIGSPRRSAEEPAFIKKFHAMYGAAVREGLANAEREAA